MTRLLSRRSFALGSLASAGLVGGLAWRSKASAPWRIQQADGR